MKQLNYYITEKLKIDKNTKYQHISFDNFYDALENYDMQEFVAKRMYGHETVCPKIQGFSYNAILYKIGIMKYREEKYLTIGFYGRQNRKNFLHINTEEELYNILDEKDIADIYNYLTSHKNVNEALKITKDTVKKGIKYEVTFENFYDLLWNYGELDLQEFAKEYHYGLPIKYIAGKKYSPVKICAGSVKQINKDAVECVLENVSNPKVKRLQYATDLTTLVYLLGQYITEDLIKYMQK